MDYDQFLVEKLGEFGRYQVFIFFVVSFAALPFGFNNMGIVFLAGVPEHWCNAPSLEHLDLTQDVIKNVSIPIKMNADGEMAYSKCEMYDRNYTGWTMEDVSNAINSGQNDSTVKCQHGWSYDPSVFGHTIVSEWDLVCDNSALQATASSVYMAGLMIGVLLFGQISDLVGRKSTLCVSLVLEVVFNIAVAFSPNMIIFLVLRFFVALFTITLFTTAFVIVMEIVGPSWRVHTGIMIEYFWVSGYLIVGLLAYFIRNWFILQLSIAAPVAILFVYFWILPESPRWLYTQKKKEKADKIIQKWAKRNKVDIPENLEITVENAKKGYIWDLVRTPRLRCRSINLFYIWFVNSLVYYGLSLNTSNLGGDPYVNFAIAGGVEVPAYVFCQVTLTYLGRRWPLAGTMVIGGIALLCTLAVPTDLNVIVIVLAMVGKFCIACSFGMIYVFTAELYPTTVRNIGVGTGSFWARIGGVVAPYIAFLSMYGKYVPLLVFGITSLLAGLLSLLLPETKGQKLPDTIEEGENFGRKDKTEKDHKLSDKYKEDSATFNGTDGTYNPAYKHKGERF